MKKILISTIALMLITFGWIIGSGFNPASAQEVPAPRGELRVVDKSAGNWSVIIFNIFEHLMEIDKDGKLVPKLATNWRWLDDRTLEVKLRQGVKFHNGELFDAEIVQLNWEENTRLRQPHMPGAYLNFKPGSRLEIIDPQTIRLIFPEPDGGALAKLSILHIGNRQFYREFGWGGGELVNHPGSRPVGHGSL
jgi:ABC-type transport system substrate-binding protein